MLMDAWLNKMIDATAWGMEKPTAYGAFHLIFTFVGIAVCILAAYLLRNAGEKGNRAVLVSVGVFLFVLSGERWGCVEELLKRDGKPREDARWAKIKDTVGTVYWLCAVAIYLGYSFITDDWDQSWIVWPIAGVLFAALAVIMDLFGKKKS